MTDYPTEMLNSCPNCQSKSNRFWCQGHDRLYELSQQEFIYSRCQNCNLIFLALRPVETEIHNFYPKNYQPYQSKKEHKNSSNLNLSRDKLQEENQFSPTILQKIVTKSKKLSKSALTNLFPETYKQQLQEFYQPPEAGSTLLDFGCGSELFLNNARERGWNTIGIDFSPQSVEQVRANGHQALLMSSQVWDEIEDESLDCVRMNHVLEHLYDPQKKLQAIYAKMKPGGTLHIGVPNPYSITSRIFRSKWWGLECPRHIMLYSPTLLKKILASMGFSEIKLLQPTITKDFLRSCGYVLYDLGLISHDQIAKMAQRRYLAALVYPLARLAVAFGVSDRHDVICIK